MAKVPATTGKASAVTSGNSAAGIVATQPLTVAAAGINTRHAPNLLWGNFANNGAKVALANSLGAAGAVVIAPHPTGPKCKLATVWGQCNAHVGTLCAANNGTTTVGALYASLVAYNWLAAGITNKYTLASQAAVGTPAHNAYLGWCAAVAKQATAKRFMCAVKA